MKRQTEFTALILALLMVLGCLFACGKDGKVKPESVTDRANAQRYEKLKANSDKLLWVPENSHPAAAKVASVAGSGDGAKELFDSLKDGLNELKSFEGNVELSLDKLTAEGEDVLEQLGGPLKLTGRVLTDEKAVNGNLSVAAGSMSIDVKLAADGSGIVLDSPFLLTKPIFVPADRIASLLKDAAEKGGQDIDLGSMGDIFGSMGDFSDFSELGSMFQGVSDWGDGLKKWKDKKLTKKNIDHIRELVKGCVPEEAIAVSNVTPPELKGEFITFDVETECVELKLTTKTAQKFLQDLLKAVKEDAVVKDIAVSLLEAFGDEFVESLTGEAGKTVGELYDELMKLMEGICDELGDGSEPDDEDKGVFTVRRYFAGGRDVKTDVVFSEDGTKDSLNFTFWNAYANTNANEFGAKLSAEGSEYLNVVGGSNETDAKFEGTLTVPDTDDGGADLGTVKLSAVRKGEKVEAKADISGKAGDEDITCKLSYEGDKDRKTLKISGKGEGTDVGLTYESDKDDRALKLSVKDDKNEVSLDYSKEAGEETLAANFNVDGKAVSLSGAKKAKDGADLYEGELSIDKGEGEGAQVVKFECEHKKTQTGEKTGHNCKIKLAVADMAEIEATLVLSLDKASKNAPEAPVKDGAFELTEDVTEEQLRELLSPQLAGVFEELFGDGDDDGDDDDGDDDDDDWFYDDDDDDDDDDGDEPYDGDGDEPYDGDGDEPYDGDGDEPYDDDSEDWFYNDEPSGTYELIRLRTDGEQIDFEELSTAEFDDSYITFNDDGTGEIYMDDDSMDAPVPFYWEDNALFAERGAEAFMHYELNEADVVTIFIDVDDGYMEVDFRLS